MVKNYKIFEGEELKIADLIQKRRLQLLIHSCIYYELNANVISDKQWDEWARELVKLQADYPAISKKVCMYEDFKDWDASTGAFLPIRTDEVKARAKCVLRACGSYHAPKEQKVEKKLVGKPRLF